MDISSYDEEPIDAGITNLYDQVSELIEFRNGIESKLSSYEKSLIANDVSIQQQQIVIQKIRGEITSNPNLNENNKKYQSNNAVERQSAELIYSELQSISSLLDSTEEYDNLLRSEYSSLKQKISESEQFYDRKIQLISNELENFTVENDEFKAKIDALYNHIKKLEYEVEHTESSVQQQNFNLKNTILLTEQKFLEQTSESKINLMKKISDLSNHLMELEDKGGELNYNNKRTALEQKLNQKKLDLKEFEQKFENSQEELKLEEATELDLSDHIEKYEELALKKLNYEVIHLHQSYRLNGAKENDHLRKENLLLKKFLCESQIQLENEILLDNTIKGDLLEVDNELKLIEKKEATLIDQEKSLRKAHQSSSENLELANREVAECKKLSDAILKKEHIFKSEIKALEEQKTVINKNIEDLNNEVIKMQEHISRENIQKIDEIKNLERENADLYEKIRHSKEIVQCYRKLKPKKQHHEEKNKTED